MDTAFPADAGLVCTTGMTALATVCGVIVKHGAGFAAFNLRRDTFCRAGFAIAFAVDASNSVTTGNAAIAAVECIVLEVDAIVSAALRAVRRNLDVLAFAIDTGLVVGTFVVAICRRSSTGGFISASRKADHAGNRNTHQFESVFSHGFSLKKK